MSQQHIHPKRHCCMVRATCPCPFQTSTSSRENTPRPKPDHRSHPSMAVDTNRYKHQKAIAGSLTFKHVAACYKDSSNITLVCIHDLSVKRIPLKHTEVQACCGNHHDSMHATPCLPPLARRASIYPIIYSHMSPPAIPKHPAQIKSFGMLTQKLLHPPLSRSIQHKSNDLEG